MRTLSEHHPEGRDPVVPVPNRLLLLGGFELSVGSMAVDLPLTAQRLATFLGLHNRPVHRSYVAGTLWPESSEDRAGASLRSALFRLRSPGTDLVKSSGTHLQLSTNVAVDMLRSVGLAHRLAAGEHIEHLDQLVGQFEEELLPGWYDEWVPVWRERWRHTRLHALETLALRLAQAGNFGRAVDAGLAAVTAEPLRESAHRALIVTHAAEGNRDEALRQYHAYRRALRDELGIEPSPAMEQLVAPLRSR